MEESTPILESEVRPDSLTFLARRQKQDSHFDVTNKGEMHQMYKLKTNNNKEYKISPHMFALGLNERKRVFVTFLGHTDKPAKNRITLVCLPFPNEKVSVEQAWIMHETPEVRQYVKILFKEDQRRSISEVNEKEKSQVGNKSQTAQPGSSRMEPSSSAGRDDSYYAILPSGVAKGAVRKRRSETNKDTNEEPNNRSDKDDDPLFYIPDLAVKPGSRRKVVPPRSDDSEDINEDMNKGKNRRSNIDPLFYSPGCSPKPRSRRKASVPPRSAGTEEEKTDDEMAEAPIAPKTTQTRKQQLIQQEEEEVEAPLPPIKPAGKPRSRRTRTHYQSTNDEADDLLTTVYPKSKEEDEDD